MTEVGGVGLVILEEAWDQHSLSAQHCASRVPSTSRIQRGESALLAPESFTVSPRMSVWVMERLGSAYLCHMTLKGTGGMAGCPSCRHGPVESIVAQWMLLDVEGDRLF